MQIIKLDAIDSTNLYVKNTVLPLAPEKLVVVVAANQMKGRGQLGTTWSSEAGKNLTFSILKKINTLPPSRQFELTVRVSVAVYEALKMLSIPELAIKWPNDILSGKHKIVGILIENILSGNSIRYSIIGIGLNVNQSHFPNLLNVSSLKLLLGIELDLQVVLETILVQLSDTLDKVSDEVSNTLWEDYRERLFGIGKICQFSSAKSGNFEGEIIGVSSQGKLQVKHKDGTLNSYGLKEIRMLY